LRGADLPPEHADGRPAVFLDRDGVLNELVVDRRLGTRESPYDPDDVRLVDGAAAAVRALQDAGWTLVAVSNQPAAAKGQTTLDALAAVHRRVAELLAAEGGSIEDWRYCHHHPDAVVAELRGPCDCRKPRPGLLLDAARDAGLDLARSWMVGDSDTDVEAGVAAGTRTVLVAAPGSEHRRAGRVRPDVQANDLADALSHIDGPSRYPLRHARPDQDEDLR
jgi:D-glycero-D-manno-heptose 1,7-bisphosphate phosphatase